MYNHGYTYDALDRLTGQSDNTSFRLWTYDANSNRTSEQSGSNIYPYAIDINSNRLLSVAGPVIKTYLYDAAGNPLTDGLAAYTWNAAGRLSQVLRNGKTYQSQYNGLGERVDKAENPNLNGHHFFFYDEAGQLVGEYREHLTTPQSNDWSLIQETIWLDNMPVTVIKQAAPADPITVYNIHADHLNTPRVIVDATNTPVWQWTNRNAFGDNLPNEDPDGDSQLFEYNLRFAGQYFDTETKLHYNYYRDYDPATGRYLSSDPIGLAGGLNTYLYAATNPLTYVDPYGLFELPVLPQGIVDATAGVGDAISSGFGLFDTSLSEIARETIGVNNSVNRCSAAYTGGRYAGYGFGIGFAGTSLYRGYQLVCELSIGRNLRIAPFGNRTGHPTGRLPHYHRRTIDSATGNTKPGQGIGRHRPWDNKTTDKSFMDKF